jgi:hypothetical protein
MIAYDDEDVDRIRRQQENARYEERIKALEKQCAVLAEQVDRQGKVVEAARYTTGSYSDLYALRQSVADYDAAMAQLAKGTG